MKDHLWGLPSTWILSVSIQKPNHLDSTYRDTAPLKANYVHKTLMDVLVFGDKVQTKMEGKDRGIKDVRGGFGKDCQILSAQGVGGRPVG